MTIWRPAQNIRFKALGLHWRGDSLLAAEVPDDTGHVKGVRPLGGTVEFGETAEAALIREFQEELGLRIDILGPPVFMENLYTHEGSVGHEVLALFDVGFPEGAYTGATRISFQEDNGTTCWAEWFDLASLDVDGGPELFPSGLKDVLIARRGQT